MSSTNVSSHFHWHQIPRSDSVNQRNPLGPISAPRIFRQGKCLARSWAYHKHGPWQIAHWETSVFNYTWNGKGVQQVEVLGGFLQRRQQQGIKWQKRESWGKRNVLLDLADINDVQYQIVKQGPTMIARIPKSYICLLFCDNILHIWCKHDFSYIYICTFLQSDLNLDWRGWVTTMAHYKRSSFTIFPFSIINSKSTDNVNTK